MRYLPRLVALVALFALAPPAFADPPGTPAPSALQQALVRMPAEVITAPAPAAPVNPEDPAGLLMQIVQLSGQGWGALLLGIPYGLLLLIWLARKFLANRVPWLATDPGGAVLALLGAACTSLIVAASLPGPHTVIGILLVAGPLFIHNAAVFGALKKLGIDLSVDPPAEPPKPISMSGMPISMSGMPLALLLVCAFGLSSCAFLRPLEPKLVKCLTNPGGKLLTEVGGALAKGGNEWQGELDNLAIAHGFEAVLCAIGVFAEALENPRPNGGAGVTTVTVECAGAGCLPEVDNSVKLIRARAYLTEARTRLQLAP